MREPWCKEIEVRVMVFNSTFNNISVILWHSEYPGKTTDLSRITDKLYHIMRINVVIEYTSP